MNAWHFVGENCRTQFTDEPVIVGETLRVNGPLEMCVHGLHASERLIDALDYAPGPILCLVRLDGEILREQNFCASQRTVEWMGDISQELWRFARQCALDVAHLWDMPEIVREYLETGDEALRVAARDAAWGTACHAEQDFAWCSARDAAWCAARDKVRGSAWAAGRAAAMAAAWDAIQDVEWCAAWEGAWCVARDDQNARLTSMIMARIASEVTP